ncbi:transcriptional regulator, HxlR family [Modestobacter sp. DSM 44400]|uniref:winged helix-turn-helix transcriptional regulator n=1 Tax=Modestobacter sp. DSM 44400 TaxID=1550230 RepID=UPI00089BFAC8|nr:helix-turn-helix domain-containing protein [Modestobacter sp. DSM 44400]SDY90317.1 transcriptional regulator, HxlR family [Modestobacter sp. DSM 44400]
MTAAGEWGEVPHGDCSIARTMSRVGAPWTLVVVRDLMLGVRRFDDLVAHLGIARNVLARRLDELVDAGLVEAVPYREEGRRPRREYRLTARGADLRPVLFALLAFGDAHLADDDGPPAHLVHRDCGGQVHLAARCTCRHDVDLDDVRVIPAG